MNEEFHNLPQGIDPEFLRKILRDRKTMIALTRRSFFWFFYFYFSRYLKYPIAPFHLKMIEIAQDEKIKRAGVMAFRNSAKSTILNTAYALWAVMGIQQKKHVVIASQTQQRAKDHLMNIRKEIESNQLLSENLGPFRETEDRWHASTLIVTNYGARITAISVEEGIRGLREGPYRPDVIIADDIEDSSSVKTRESREKSFNWFSGELLPLGEVDAKVIILGNFLNQNSVLSRLEEMIKTGKMKGIFLRVPIVDENNNISWPGKFPSLEAIEDLRQSIGNELTWQRDFLLRAIPDDYQVILPQWIKRYDAFPQDSELKYRYTLISIDPAISQEESADFTAMIPVSVYGQRENLKVFIHPEIVNERLTVQSIKEKAKFLSQNLGRGTLAKILVEEVGFQGIIPQELKGENLPAEGCKIQGDKRERLSIAASLMEQGKVFFPKQGAEKLIGQLLGFGIESHDDLVDAFSLVMIEIIKRENGGRFFLLRADGKDFFSSPPTTPKDNKPKPEDPRPGLLPEKIELPWNDEKELKRLERQADLECMRKSEFERSDGAKQY